ncbi:hypothetical protein [Okeania sp. SIO1I7]|nr:hypothetical protein [Okeania sp. SIO1I7]
MAGQPSNQFPIFLLYSRRKKGRSKKEEGRIWCCLSFKLLDSPAW